MNVYRVRWDFLEDWVASKTVLDVGAAELVGTVNQEKRERWIHHRMSGVAARLTGLEINREQVEALCEQGYDIRQGSAEDFDLGETFDVVVAGELIEHLSNPGGFLESAKRHLKKDGVLLLTTPNRFSCFALWHVLRHGKVPEYPKPIAKHVVFFDQVSLRDLLTRHGYTDVQIGYYEWVGAPVDQFWTKRSLALLRRYRPHLLPGLTCVARAASA